MSEFGGKPGLEDFETLSSREVIPELYTAALEESEHPNHLVKVLERTGHGMLVMDRDAPYKPATPHVQAREYFELLHKWLSEQGL